MLQLGILGLLSVIVYIQLFGAMFPPDIGKRRKKRSSGSEYEGCLSALEMVHSEPIDKL